MTALTRHGTTVGHVALRAAPGRLTARPVELRECAPGVWCRADLVLDSELPPTALRAVVPHPPCVALQHEPRGEPVIESGRGVLAGRLRLAPELLCAPRCYTGFAAGSPEEAEWAARTLLPPEEALRVETEELRARRALYSSGPRALNYSVLLHTDLAVMVPVTVTARLEWPRLVPVSLDAGLVGIGAHRRLDVRLTNPSGSHALLVQALLAATLQGDGVEGRGARTERGAAAFSLRGIGAPGGGVRIIGELLELAPRAEVSLHVEFRPLSAITHRAPLFLRNNLTLLEVVRLSGTGAVPSLKLAERRPGSPVPVSFEPRGPGCRLTVKRELIAHNTGPVPVAVRGLLVGGAVCEGHGFKVEDCGAFSLQPNETRVVKVSFTADLTLGRVSRPLRLELAPGQPADFWLEGTVPPELAAACVGSQPRPPWERSLRRAFSALSLLVLVGALCAAMLDSDRLLQRTLGRRSHPPPAPLDLRALNLAPSLSPLPRHPAPTVLPVPPPPGPPRGVRRRLTRRPHDSLPEYPRDPSPPPCPTVPLPTCAAPVRPAPPPPQEPPAPPPEPLDDDSSTTTDSSAGDDRDKVSIHLSTVRQYIDGMSVHCTCTVRVAGDGPERCRKCVCGVQEGSGGGACDRSGREGRGATGRAQGRRRQARGTGGTRRGHTGQEGAAGQETSRENHATGHVRARGTAVGRYLQLGGGPQRPSRPYSAPAAARPASRLAPRGPVSLPLPPAAARLRRARAFRRQQLPVLLQSRGGRDRRLAGLGGRVAPRARAGVTTRGARLRPVLIPLPDLHMGPHRGRSAHRLDPPALAPRDTSVAFATSTTINDTRSV